MEYSYWWCNACRKQVEPQYVTFEERHDGCGYPVECITVKTHNQLETLQSRLESAEAVLREISEHEHCENGLCRPLGDGHVFMGRSQGHRCAANIAKKYFEGGE